MAGQTQNLEQYAWYFDPIEPAYAKLKHGEALIRSFYVIPCKWKKLFGLIWETPEPSISMNMQGHLTDRRLILEYRPGSDNWIRLSHNLRGLAGPIVEFGLTVALGRVGEFLGHVLTSSAELEEGVEAGAMSVKYAGIDRLVYTPSYDTVHVAWKTASDLKDPVFQAVPTVDLKHIKRGYPAAGEVLAYLAGELLGTAAAGT